MRSAPKRSPEIPKLRSFTASSHRKRGRGAIRGRTQRSMLNPGRRKLVGPTASIAWSSTRSSREFAASAGTPGARREGRGSEQSRKSYLDGLAAATQIGAGQLCQPVSRTGKRCTRRSPGALDKCRGSNRTGLLACRRWSPRQSSSWRSSNRGPPPDRDGATELSELRQIRRRPPRDHAEERAEGDAGGGVDRRSSHPPRKAASSAPN